MPRDRRATLPLGVSGASYWAHRSGERCENTITHAYGLCPEHYKLWRDAAPDWKKLSKPKGDEPQ